MHKGSGRLFVITAPSGAGKTSLCRDLMEHVRGLRFSISHTTRKPRGEEVHGHDYYYVEESEFLSMAEAGRFAEYAQIHGHYYGTSLDEVERAVKDEVDLLLDIEGQGAEQIKATRPDSVFIFILTPTMEDLRSRLYHRHSDSEQEIERRMAHAKKEIEYLPNYDYIIVNDDFEEALLCFMSIVYAERSRRQAVLSTLPDEYRKE